MLYIYSFNKQIGGCISNINCRPKICSQYSFYYKRLNRQFVIEDDKGKTMTAMKVFSSALRYLKDNMLLTCQKSVPDINKGDIRWVLTVPAIWSDSSKQFMREAAGEVNMILFLFS